MIHRRISSIWSPWVAEIRSNLTTLTGCEKRSVISSCDHAHPLHTSFATSLGPHESASMSGIWVNSSIFAGLIGVPSTKTSLRYDICTNRLHRFMIVALAMRPNNSTHTHTRLTAIFPGLPRWAGTRKVNQSGFYWSKRQWEAVASAGPCASLHLAPDR